MITITEGTDKDNLNTSDVGTSRPRRHNTMHAFKILRVGRVSGEKGSYLYASTDYDDSAKGRIPERDNLCPQASHTHNHSQGREGYLKISILFFMAFRAK